MVTTSYTGLSPEAFYLDDSYTEQLKLLLQNSWMAAGKLDPTFLQSNVTPFGPVEGDNGNINTFLRKTGDRGYNTIADYFNYINTNEDPRFQYTPELIKNVFETDWEANKTVPWKLTYDEKWNYLTSDTHRKAAEWYQDRFRDLNDWDRSERANEIKNIDIAIQNGWDPHTGNVWGSDALTVTLDEVINGNFGTVKNLEKDRQEEPEVPINEGELYQPYTGPDVSSLFDMLGDRMKPVTTPAASMTKKPEVSSVQSVVANNHKAESQIWQKTLSTAEADFLRP